MDCWLNECIMATEALLILGLQVDYCRGGAVEVVGTDELVPLVNEWIERVPLAVFVQDWYPADHCIFAANHLWRKPGQQLSFAAGSDQSLSYELMHMHCVQGSFGAEPATRLAMTHIKKVIRRGLRHDVPSLHAFADLDQHSTGLCEWLQEAGVSKLVIMGVPLESLVYPTALAALRLGFVTSLVGSGCLAISPDQQQHLLDSLRAEGVDII